jgi:hypothetical protein
MGFFKCFCLKKPMDIAHRLKKALNKFFVRAEPVEAHLLPFDLARYFVTAFRQAQCERTYSVFA